MAVRGLPCCLANTHRDGSTNNEVWRARPQRWLIGCRTGSKISSLPAVGTISGCYCLWFKTTPMCSLPALRLDVRNEGASRLMLPLRLWGEWTCPCLFPASVLLAGPGGSWLAAASSTPPPPWLSRGLFPVCVCLHMAFSSMCLFYCLTRTPVILDSDPRLSLNVTTSAKILFQTRSQSQVPGVSISTHLLGETFQSTIITQDKWS